MSARGFLRSIKAKASLASPVFTGTPTVPTKAISADSLSAANVTMIRQAAASIVGAAPASMDTVAEVAAAVNNDPSYYSTVSTALAGKQTSDATLTALAALVTSADKVIRATGADAFDVLDLMDFKTWSPGITLATPGTFVSGIAGSVGRYCKIGKLCYLQGTFKTTPVYGTGSGALRISNLPFQATATGVSGVGGLSYHTTGLSYPAGYTQCSLNIDPNNQFATIRALGSGQNGQDLTVSNLTASVETTLSFWLVYLTV